MMNLLARILSHGFAFAVVALIILVLMYRGEFPVWELPESLAIKGLPGTAQEAGSGTVDRVTEQAADATVAVPPEAPEVPLAPASSTATRETTQSEDEAPATDIKPPTESETSPAPVIEPAAETTDVAEPDERIDTGAATDSQPVEFDDAPSATAAVESDESMAQSTDKVSAQTTADTPVGTGDVAADESTTTAEVVPDDATAETATAIETAPIVAVEETAPAEAAPTTEEQTVTSPVASEEPATTADSLSAAEPLAAPVNEVAPQAIENDVSESPYEVMAKAREAFWLRDFELAEQQYQKLTQLEPDNPDGYGEMGNMYFSQGKWEEAAAAYYQAGARLLNDGLVQEARQMVDVIRGLNGAQADDLEAQINAASAPSP
jgi:Flp pilus assembly protein TadD